MTNPSLSTLRRLAGHTGHVALSLIACAGLLSPWAAAQAADLTILVDNVQQPGGQVMLGLFNSVESFPKTVAKGAMAPATERDASGRVRLVLTGLTPGQYAVSAFHDTDGNGKLTTNLMGMPTEPYGFSNNAQGQFGPPAFADAAFTVTAQDLTITLQVK